MKATAIICAVLLTACGEVLETHEQKSARGDARIELFKECMELAAALPRQSDDKVFEVVNACSSQSYYMTNYR